MINHRRFAMTQATQKTWFITGASSGLGRAMTEQLLERGDCVAATLRRPERLDELKTRYGDRLWVAAMDVTDTAAIRATVGGPSLSSAESMWWLVMLAMACSAQERS
ncbi:SDR family NAD(P)-dependent oxidoreductase [Modicisalibacter luteus]|uniref:SDR family NAD(P)-dependent oxidoreductase n=1 Tax=Modicisalibacter luteus TaxID=453962 RepID=UPI003630DD7C